MSVIIAVKDGNTAYLGFDSRGTTGSKYFTYSLHDAKCFKAKDPNFNIIFGVVGSHKLSCFIRQMNLPYYTGNVHSWLFSILQSLATHPEFENIFIVINNDIYKCWNNMPYYLVTDVATLGSGQHIALGAYAALDHLALKERLRKSLAITADIDNGCGQPFYLLNGATYAYESL